MRAVERRRESRFRYCALLTVVGSNLPPVAATVRNLSSSGICLEMTVGIEPGTLVCLDGPGFLAQGLVTYCERHGLRYRVGVAMEPLEAA